MAPRHALRHAAFAVVVGVLPLCPGCACWRSGGTDQEPNYREGLRHFLAGSPAAATRRFQSFLADYPSSPYASDAHYFLGVMAVGRGAAAEAEPHLKAALRAPRTDQTAEGAALALARCHFLRGTYGLCRKACLDILRKNPASPRADDVLFLLANASGRLGRDDEARHYYRELANRFPSSPRAEAARKRLGGAAAPTPTVRPIPLGGSHEVQVAALASERKAAAMAAPLRAKGYSVRLKPIRVGGATLHAVRVGPYPTKRAAEQAAAKLRADGFSPIIKP